MFFTALFARFNNSLLMKKIIKIVSDLFIGSDGLISRTETNLWLGRYSDGLEIETNGAS